MWRRYLEWVSLAVLGHHLDDFRGVAELAHLPGAPGVHIPLLVLVAAILPEEVIEVVSAIDRHYLLPGHGARRREYQRVLLRVHVATCTAASPQAASLMV